MVDLTWDLAEEPTLEWDIIDAVAKPEQTKSVTPRYEQQTVTPDEGFTLRSVIVGAIPDPTATIDIDENGDYDLARIGTAHVAVPQGVFPAGTKNITQNGVENVRDFEQVDVQVPQGVFPSGTKTITANGTGIDVEQYAAVDVAVPQGVFPSGTKQITENGTGIDVTNYAAVDVAVPGIVPTGTKQISITQNGTTTHDVTNYASAEIVTNVNTDPAKGLVFGDYDADGYPHSARFMGTWTEIPMRFLYYSQYYASSVLGKVDAITIPDGVTIIKDAAFQSFYYATIVNMPHNNITVEKNSFHSCGNVIEYHFYGDVVINGSQAFDGNASLKRLIFDKNVSQITNQCFRNANALELIDFSHCTAIPPLYSVASLGHAVDCVIKIPAALSDTTLGTGNGWESETNWNALTNIVWEVV